MNTLNMTPHPLMVLNIEGKLVATLRVSFIIAPPRVVINTLSKGVETFQTESGEIASLI